MNALPSAWMYGGGRQSAAIAVLIIKGQIPMPDWVCIADTGREKTTTWNYLRDVVQPAFPKQIHIIDKAQYATVDLYRNDDLLIPAFTNINGGVSKLETFCSNEWKARVCDRWLKKTQRVKKFIPWIGFSFDERRRWEAKRRSMGDGVWFPLVDAVRMGKTDCVELVKSFGWPSPPGSACWMCPNQDDGDWLANTPEDMEKAAALEKELQAKDPYIFLHRSCVPIDQVKFDPRKKGKTCDSGLCMV